MNKNYPPSRCEYDEVNKTNFLTKFKFAIVLLFFAFTASSYAQQVFTVVDGTFQATVQGVSPFATVVKSQRSQYLYTGDLLQNLNAPNGYITAVAIKITQLAAPSGVKPQNVQIKMGLTPLTVLPENFIADLPVHYSSAVENITTTGWYTFNLDTPFAWDGFSNIAIEFCRTNEITGSSFEIAVALGLIDEYRTVGMVSNATNSNGCMLEGNNVVSLPNRRLLPSMRFTMSNPCEMNPNAGTIVVSNSANYCSEPFTLAATGDSIESGLSFQWQSSTDGINYVNIAGATAPTLTTTQQFPTYYRRGIMCDELGVMIYPPALLVSGIGCLCNPTVSFQDATGITNVTFGTINKNSDSTPYYSDFRSTQTTVNRESAYTLSARVTSVTGSLFTKGWIDWNNDGVFSESESYNLGSISTGSDVPSGSNASIVVPANAALGLLTMRVRTAEAANISALDPCNNAANGETEDYSILIQPSLSLPGASILESSITVLSRDKSVQVRSTVEDIKGIKIYDISGRLLYTSNSDLNEKVLSIPVSKVSSQVLIVEIRTVSGYTLNRKVSLN